MPLIPPVASYRLQEIATQMWRLCHERGWRPGWMTPEVLTKPSRVSLYGIEPDVIPRDWLGQLVTDMPARELTPFERTAEALEWNAFDYRIAADRACAGDL